MEVYKKPEMSLLSSVNCIFLLWIFHNNNFSWHWSIFLNESLNHFYKTKSRKVFREKLSSRLQVNVYILIYHFYIPWRRVLTWSPNTLFSKWLVWEISTNSILPKCFVVIFFSKEKFFKRTLFSYTVRWLLSLFLL